MGVGGLRNRNRPVYRNPVWGACSQVCSHRDRANCHNLDEGACGCSRNLHHSGPYSYLCPRYGLFRNNRNRDRGKCRVLCPGEIGEGPVARIHLSHGRMGPIWNNLTCLQWDERGVE